jgi:3',5'-nucleoside bisphosphate phosphatase
MLRRFVVFPVFCLLLLLSLVAQGQVRHEINFPDVPGYVTLKCDFHTHTVFSDGTVWPTVRVDEAWRLGLDAIAVSDHIEYQPHRADLPTNHNRPYEIAAGRARERNLLFPRAAEITRDTPPGHFNAIFLQDIDPLDTEDFLEVIQRANEQGAFVFWNHHDWKGPERGDWMDVHTQLYEKKWLHGMEVANGSTYYPRAHQWCLDRGLTMIGASDIHGPDLMERMTADQHRTLTLVFAEERTLDSLHQALRAGRTAVWIEERMIGRRDVLEPLFEACFHVAQPHLRTGNAVWTTVKNHSAIDIHLQRAGSVGPERLTFPAGATTLLRVTGGQPDEPIELSYTATNFWIAPETGLPVTLRIPGK